MHVNPCIHCAIKNVLQNEYRCRWRMVYDESGGVEAQEETHDAAHRAFHNLEMIEATETGLDNPKRIKKFNVQKSLRESDPKIRKVYNKLFVLVEDFRILSSSESGLYKKFKLTYIEEERFLDKKNSFIN